MGSRNGTPVRFREDTGWEFRCAECTRKDAARYWPLGDEFWDHARGMLRCRACWRAHDNARMRAYYQSRPEEQKERRRQQHREYRRRAGQTTVEKLRWERIRNDPVLLERARATGRAAQARYRERQKNAA